MTSTATPPPPEVLDVDAGVIDDARLRQQRQRRNLARCALVAILVGCVVYLAVSGGHEWRSSPPASPIGDLSSCTSRELRPTSHVAGLAGSLAVTVEVANIGASACRLVGEPSVQLYVAGAGGPLREGGVGRQGVERLRPVSVLGRGASASIIVLWGNWCRATPHGGPTLIVQLAHGGGELRLRLGEVYASCVGGASTRPVLRIAPPGVWGRQVDPTTRVRA